MHDRKEHICVIASEGWIFEGYKIAEPFILDDANVVRSWDNGLGIGGIAKIEHKDEYVLDHVGRMDINPDAVIATIYLEW